MDDIYNISLVEKVSNFLHTYPVETSEVSNKTKKVEKCTRLMRKYIDIPEVWIREVHEVFSDMIALLMRITPQHANEGNEAFKTSALQAREALIIPLMAFQDGRRDWLHDHPQELEFVFNKMRYKGFRNVKEWGVTDACQFQEITVAALFVKLVGMDTESEETKHILDLYGKVKNNNADVLSVIKTYKDNDVYSIDLRRQLMHLHEDIKRGQYQETTSRVLSPFLLEAAYKLWGWGDFVTQSSSVPPVPRDVYVLQMTGAPGSQADTLNGMYVETKETQNSRRIFKKTSMVIGNHLWLRSTQGKWFVSKTQDLKDNTTIGLACTVTREKTPMDVLWKVWNADGDKKSKDYPDFKCKQISFADLLWALDDCDVVINALPVSEIQNLISKCFELRMVHLDSTSEPNIIRHLEEVGHTLQRMLTARNAEIPAEPGECGQCMERRATEIFLPCHHVVVCSSCSKGKTECPFCRESIDASCNFGVYMTRTSHAPKQIWDVTKPMDQDANMTSLLLQLRDLH
jgi:hypothetical protein